VQDESTQTFDRLTAARRCDDVQGSPKPDAEIPPNTLQTGRCGARNKQGDPCAAPALKGAQLCLAHSGQTRLDSAKGAQRSAEVRQEKARLRRETLRDKLARKLEEHADEVVAAYLAGIRSDDPNRAYRAADAWISRVHGRPKETVENVTAFDDPLDVSKMTREQLGALKREILRQHPELVEQYMGIRAVE
jgi:hypothetical protein